MSFEITGSVHRIGDVERKASKTSGKEFVTREFVISVKEGEYTQIIAFELFGDQRVGYVYGLALGQTVTVKFDISGRDWTDPKTGKVRTFVTLKAWHIEGQPVQKPVGLDQVAAPIPSAVPNATLFTQPANPEPTDDLPF